MHGPTSPSGGGKKYVGWEEKFVSNDRGNRVVHLILKDRQGQSTLAVVGNEKSRRHMVYMISEEFFAQAGLDRNTTWRSRREVVDWLSSLCSNPSPCRSNSHATGSPPFSEGPENMQDEQANNSSQDVLWVGTPWTCRKRLKHYKSFTRNGITISVKSFVFVMSEEENRIVHHLAYIEDMYEDKKARKKLRVRWFHKTNELACKIPAPPPHPTEVFFTQFSQVISVECVDGLATVLAPEHFEKCSSVFTADAMELIHVCSRQFDGEAVKHLNICDVEGYWFQKALGPIGVSPPRGTSELGSDEEEEEEVEAGNAFGRALRSTRYCRRKVTKGHSNSSSPTTDTDGHGYSDADPCKSAFNVGDKVELLCQDSGLRGCWFTGVIINKMARRVKVRYDDLRDEDGKDHLEEWVSASKFVSSDKLNIHSTRRRTIRPSFHVNSSAITWSFGCPVDVWWNDGWWEGVVISRNVGRDVRVYFPDEDEIEIFKLSELRPSRDWVNGQWHTLKATPEIISAIDYSIIARGNALQNCRYLQSLDEVEPDSSRETSKDEIDEQLLRIAEAAEAGLRKLEEDNPEKFSADKSGKRKFETLTYCKHSKEVSAEDTPVDLELDTPSSWMASDNGGSSSGKKPRLSNSLHNPLGSSLPPLVMSR